MHLASESDGGSSVHGPFSSDARKSTNHRILLSLKSRCSGLVVCLFRLQTLVGAQRRVNADAYVWTRSWSAERTDNPADSLARRVGLGRTVSRRDAIRLSGAASGRCGGARPGRLSARPPSARAARP